MKKKLITSALPYVNNVPHLGNIIGSVLSADVYARFCRGMGYETLYICATDEYGTATENKARSENMTPEEICNKYHAIHREVYEHFAISFDFFGRTSTPEHTEITQAYFRDLRDNGYIEEKTSEQVFCEHCDMFIADRYVEGTCPHCAHPDARGDQCDKCSKLLEPADLVDPRCAHCGNAPVTRETNHLYVNLKRLQGALTDFFQKTSVDGTWPVNALTTTKSWLDKGLEARPITRDLKWGIPVPHPGYEKKVFYVWFDAPIGYVSQTRRYLPDTWQDWWLDPEHTELVQFMAKDNIPFHTVIFPACQIGSGKNWTMLHHISSTEYLNYEDSKFSKSNGVGVFGDMVAEIGIDIELWRLYLILNRPEKADVRFSWDGFFEEINSTFIDNIGNLLNRTGVFIAKHFAGTLPTVALPEAVKHFDSAAAESAHRVVALYDAVALREAAHSTLHLGNRGNKLFQENRPWELIKQDRETCAAVLQVIVHLLSDIACLLTPIMPNTANRIFAVLGQTALPISDAGKRPGVFGARTLGRPELLFAKLDPKMAGELRRKYAGTQPTETAAPSPHEEIFAHAALKVGKIMAVERHPNAERLYVERIDCGAGDVRQVVSGIVSHFTEAELLNRHVVVVTGLAPAKIRGEVSTGMLLTFEQGDRLELPDLDDIPPGTPVCLENAPPTAPASPKPVSIDAFYSLDLTLTEGRVTMHGKNLTVSAKPLVAPTFLTGKVT